MASSGSPSLYTPYPDPESSPEPEGFIPAEPDLELHTSLEPKLYTPPDLSPSGPVSAPVPHISIAQRIIISVMSIMMVVFVSLGIGFAVPALQNSETATATIVEMSGSTTTVTYEVDGQTYEQELSEVNTSWHNGDEVTVYYRPGDPSHVSAVVWRILALVFSSIGAFFLVISAAVASVALRKRAITRALLQAGRRIEATITSVDQDFTTHVNGRFPWLVTCSWHDPETGRTFVFRSQTTIDDPRPLMASSGRTTLVVYIDPADPEKKYFVDASPLGIR